ncbi:hypothetical protein HWV62_22040 [Athelia sp. TMB]|nr:hypothetical protein HWV62_22040 [Athelia sp. TMB]
MDRTVAPNDFASVAASVVKSRAKDRTLFNATVLELVKLIQAALAVSGMIPTPTSGGPTGGFEIDGLLCDLTVEGIKKWVSEVGEGCVGVESQSTQNLLSSPVGGVVYLTAHTVNSIATAFATKTRTSDAMKMHRVLFNKLDGLATDLRGGEVGGGSISDDDEGAGRTGKKVSGISRKGGTGSEKEGAGGQLLSGIGSLASGLGLGGGGAGGAGSISEPTSDLRAFANTLLAGERGRDREWEKDLDESGERGTAACLKGLWSGHVEVVLRMRERERAKHAPVSAPKKPESERERGGLYSDGDTDGGETYEDESDVFGGGGGKPWSGRMQKKIEAWAKLNRPKKASVDFSNAGGLIAPPMSSESSTNASQLRHNAIVTSPTLAAVSSRDFEDEELLSSGQIITSSLASTNATLHADYHSHEQIMDELARRAQVLAQIEAERVKTDGTTQERNTLLYESEQFRVQELWQMASPPRQKVLDLREKVFGTGGRRLPNGVRGAHGRFNRLQWTLDGGERLVDLLGRTESEAEEEEGLEAVADHVEGEEEDVVENPRIKPMWLLRFFTSWGTRWSSPPTEAPKYKDPLFGAGNPTSPQDNGEHVHVKSS